MIGASIYIVPIMIQRNVAGIGPFVLPAFLLAAVPALLAAFAYASLSSAMPRAGGSYIFASRGLHPYWGFVDRCSFGLEKRSHLLRDRMDTTDIVPRSSLDICGYQHARVTVL